MLTDVPTGPPAGEKLESVSAFDVEAVRAINKISWLMRAVVPASASFVREGSNLIWNMRPASGAENGDSADLQEN